MHVRTKAKWPFFSILRVFKESFFRQRKNGPFLAKFGQELQFGIPMKIRMVQLVFETSRNFRNFACPDSGKMAIFKYFQGISRKLF